MFVVDLRVALTSPSTWWCSQQNGKNESHHNAKICGSWKNAAVQQRWVRVCRNLPSTEWSHKQLQHFHSRPLLSGFRPSAFTLLAGRTTRGNDRICCAVFSTLSDIKNYPKSKLDLIPQYFLRALLTSTSNFSLSSVCPGSDVVDWLHRNIEGFTDRREARKYAGNLLKAGYIRHTVNKVTFSEQCYYVFGDLCGGEDNHTTVTQLTHFINDQYNTLFLTFR